MNRIAATLLLLLNVYCSAGQSIKGKLFGTSETGKEILPGGTLRFISSATPVTANENGVFELPLAGIDDRRIIAAEAGYHTDTIDPGSQTYLSIILHRDAHELRAVTISDNRAAYIANGVLKTEVINQKELSKAACCDLAGCFGTQASVQPQTTNVVTNAQELRILGLSGVYNQVLFDGLPMIQGLSYTYGISTYPGTIVENIYVAKGTSSVLQGYESISGQINLESKQPDKAEKLYLNGYANSFGERHFNANLASAMGRKKKWHALLALHHVQPAAKTDRNGDGFLDLPQLTRYMAYNKWKYGNDKQEGFATQIGLRLVSEERNGGQKGYNAATDKGSHLVYGQSVKYLQPEVYTKSTLRFSGKHALSLALSGFYHDQHSWLGTTEYLARQATAYINLQHEWDWHPQHSVKYGASFRYQDLAETISFSGPVPERTYAGDYQTQLAVPGVFIENTFRSPGGKMALITGIRADRHQRWGTYVTPRAMIRYEPGSSHTLRASVGRGWRQVNLFAEQAILLASSRDIVFAEVLKPESAVNWGLSDTYKFEVGENVSGTLSADFYSTRFTNQFFPDYDSDPAKVFIRNFEGVSRSDGFQAEASFIFFRRLEVRAAYNYLDVYRVENGLRVSLPFNARNRAMAAVSFPTKDKRWQFDLNAHWFDRMRLPNTGSNPVPYRRPGYSVPYATVNMQVTWRWKAIELYGGCENAGNYRQPDPIISAQQPFGRYFDLSSVWGPTRGREFYIGIRYKVM